MEEEDLEKLVEISKADYLEGVCEALIGHQDAVQQIENTMIKYFLDDVRYHVAYYSNPETGTVLYKIIEPRLGYEAEDIEE